MVCYRCKLDKPSDTFSTRNKACKLCTAKYAREKRAVARANGGCTICYKAISVYKGKMCDKCRLKHNINTKKESWRLFLSILDAYGGRFCQCCNEKTLLFLTVDHINGGGAEHRRKIKNGHTYRWLKVHGFPSGYRILCFNCNSGRARNGGICPHKGNSNG